MKKKRFKIVCVFLGGRVVGELLIVGFVPPIVFLSGDFFGLLVPLKKILRRRNFGVFFFSIVFLVDSLSIKELGFFQMIFYGFYHGIHHHVSPPFGRICFGTFFLAFNKQIQENVKNQPIRTWDR